MRLICGQLLLQKIVRPSIKINVSLLKRAKGSIILIYQFLTWQNAVVKTAPTAPPLTNPYLGLFRKASQLPTMSQIFKTQNKNKTQLIIPASVQEVFFSSNEINKKRQSRRYAAPSSVYGNWEFLIFAKRSWVRKLLRSTYIGDCRTHTNVNSVFWYLFFKDPSLYGDIHALFCLDFCDIFSSFNHDALIFMVSLNFSQFKLFFQQMGPKSCAWTRDHFMQLNFERKFNHENLIHFLFSGVTCSVIF